jgi:hypothetical protein
MGDNAPVGQEQGQWPTLQSIIGTRRTSAAGS